MALEPPPPQTPGAPTTTDAARPDQRQPIARLRAERELARLTVPSLLHDDTAAVSPTARRNLRHRPRVQGCAALWAAWLTIYEGDLDAAHGALVLALLELEAEI